MRLLTGHEPTNSVNKIQTVKKLPVISNLHELVNSGMHPIKGYNLMRLVLFNKCKEEIARIKNSMQLFNSIYSQVNFLQFL